MSIEQEFEDALRKAEGAGAIDWDREFAQDRAMISEARVGLARRRKRRWMLEVSVWLALLLAGGILAEAFNRLIVALAGS